MYTFLPIILLAIEIILVGIFVYFAIKNKIIISKKTLWYIMPLSMLMFILYSLGINYNAMITGEEITIYSYFDVCKQILKVTSFEIKQDYVYLLVEKNLYFGVAFFLCTALFIFAIYSSIFSIFINAIKNKLRVFMALRKDCDILIGNNEFNEVYLKSNKNCIIWLDVSSDKGIISKFYAKKTPVIKDNFEKETLFKRLKFCLKRNNSINLISFENSDKNLTYINEFKEFLEIKYKGKEIIDSKIFFLKVEIDFYNQITIKNRILLDSRYAAFIDCINKYDLYALSYIEKYPITKNLPDNFFDNKSATINSSTCINVFYLGFGKVSKALHRASLMNNQLAQIKNGVISPYKINYYAYDKEKKNKEDGNTLFYSKRYDTNIEKYSDSKKYFPSCEKLDNLEFQPLDLNSYEFITYIKDTMFDEASDKTFNRIIVSFGEDIENIDYALKINAFLIEHSYNNFEIFVRVEKKTQNALNLLKDTNITPIGYLESVLNHEVIVNEELIDLAKKINKKYNEKKLVDSSWYELSVIKQLSNVYSSLNTRLKLNLLGFDYEVKKQVVDNTKELEQLTNKLKYEKVSYDDYYFYKTKNYISCHCLAFQEHLRWNAFYISYGYVPMQKSSITLNNNRFYKDDDIIRVHACITTFEGLDEYHRYLASLLTSQNNQSYEDNLNEVETYKYDYMLIEEFKNIFTNTEYKLIRKRGDE